jgi:hypothetical protein
MLKIGVSSSARLFMGAGVEPLVVLIKRASPIACLSGKLGSVKSRGLLLLFSHDSPRLQRDDTTLNASPPPSGFKCPRKCVKSLRARPHVSLLRGAK